MAGDLETSHPAQLDSLCPPLSEEKSQSFSTRDALIASKAASQPFLSIESLFSQLDATEDDILRVCPVSKTAFEAICDAREERGRKWRFFFFGGLELLLITVPHGTHELLHRLLTAQMSVALEHMGLLFELVAFGSQACEGIGAGAYSAGEGDDCYKPVSFRATHEHWPTLVIESGYSQRLAEMRAKAHWWFRESEFAVKIVVLIKLERSDGRILIEKWKAIRRTNPNTNAITKSFGTPQPYCVQEITISPPDTASARLDPSAYTVISGALRLEFIDLFLRSPGPGEGDIVIDEVGLGKVAMAALRCMNWHGMASDA